VNYYPAFSCGSQGMRAHVNVKRGWQRSCCVLYLGNTCSPNSITDRSLDLYSRPNALAQERKCCLSVVTEGKRTKCCIISCLEGIVISVRLHIYYQNHPTCVLLSFKFLCTRFFIKEPTCRRPKYLKSLQLLTKIVPFIYNQCSHSQFIKLFPTLFVLSLEFQPKFK